jgi:hypothetical protein
VYPATCRRAGIYVPFHRTRGSSCRCQPWLCRDVDVGRALRSSQLFAMIPTRLTSALRTIHVAATQCQHRLAYLSEIGHTSARLNERTFGDTASPSSLVSSDPWSITYSIPLTTQQALGRLACLAHAKEPRLWSGGRPAASVKCIRCNSSC